jgi:rare lipoprotein A
MKFVTQLTVSAILAASVVSAPSLALAQSAHVQKVISGTASWYGPGFNGQLTANGERYDMHDFTAANKTLPFGTRVRVTNKDTGRSVVVRINDRGPYVRGRIIDLSKRAATTIGLMDSGTAPVTLEILS